MSPIFRRADRRTSEKTAPQSTREPRESQQAQEAGAHHLVTLIGKPGCHLCADAQAVIERVCGELGVPWESKDITQDEELHRAYWEQIPVVLVNGAQHTFWRVNEQRLRAALTE
ncbi:MULTISPECIES: glutaredoxin family protein [Streptomyces]|nr:glutaredoxin family protein [Streptomyces ruber]